MQNYQHVFINEGIPRKKYPDHWKGENILYPVPDCQEEDWTGFLSFQLTLQPTFAKGFKKKKKAWSRRQQLLLLICKSVVRENKVGINMTYKLLICNFSHVVLNVLLLLAWDWGLSFLSTFQFFISFFILLHLAERGKNCVIQRR